MISIMCCCTVVNFGIAHEINSMQLLSSVELMREERTLPWLQKKKKTAKPASSDACHVCGVNFKISIGDFGRKKEQEHIYLRYLKGLELTKFA